MRLRRHTAYMTATAAVTGLVGLAVARAADTEVPKVTNLRVVPSRFCVKRSSTCTHPGTVVRFSVSTGARVTGNIWPRTSNIAGYREFRRHFNAGANSVGSGTTANTDVRVVK